jgi:hypothetical protein
VANRPACTVKITNDEKLVHNPFRHLSIWISFVIRHSSFVINYTIARCAEFWDKRETNRILS